MTATYDPSLVVMSIGIIPISGYADGSMIEVTPVGDGVKAITGTAGETAFIETPNRQHGIKFRLMETSPINSILALAFNAGNPPQPLNILSVSTGVDMAAASCKIVRIPGTTYDNGVPVREWELVVPRLDTIMVPVNV